VSGNTSNATLSHPVCQHDMHKFTFQSSKIYWPICQLPKEFKFSLELHGRTGGGVPGQSFMTERSQSFACHRIHQTTFGTRRFADRGFGDSLVDGVISRLRRPVSEGSIGPKGCVGSVCCSMLTKLQSLFCLPKIEL
jgi:hypothetical protein